MRELHAFFPDVAPEALHQARGLIEVVDVDYGTELMRQGEEDRSLLALVEGEVSLRRGDVEIALASAGEVVGEMEFFGPQRRIASAKAVSPCTALIIERSSFDALRRPGNATAWAIERLVLAQSVARLRKYHVRIAELARGTEKERTVPAPGIMEWVATSLGMWGTNPGRQVNRAEALRHNPHFSTAPPEILQAITDSMKARRFKEGQVVCRHGEPASCTFFLVGGAVEVVVGTKEDRGDPVAILEPGAIFGFTSMVAYRDRMASCIAKTDVLTLTLDRKRWDEFSVAPGVVASTLRRAIASDLGEQAAKAIDHLAQLELTVRQEVATEFKSSPAMEKEPTLHDLYFRR